MQLKSRVVAVAASAVLPLLLVTACGGNGTDAGSTNNLTPIQGSSYVTMEPATTTTTTTLPVSGDSVGPEPGTISETEQIYVVQPNDGPAKIANLYGITMEQLFAYNSYPEGEQHVFLVGEEVRIPPGAQVPAAGGSTDGATTGDTTGDATGDTTVDDTDDATGAGCTHVIEAGENPTKVANQYDLTYDQLQAANPGMDFTTTFVVGDVLTIPPEGDCG